MRIAYVSFEYPPDTAVGGIATYVYQVSKMMHSRGHEVEVFTASPTRTVSEDFEGVHVHRIQTNSRNDFPKEILNIFKIRHQIKQFDILESPEFSGDGYEIKKAFPDLPLVVKLHSPSFLLKKIDTFHLRLVDKARFILGGIIRQDNREPYWNWKESSQDVECALTSLADQIHSPSESLRELASQKWRIHKERIFLVPNPFIPNNKFLNIPLDTETKTVTFIGRLEYKKGITFLVAAIPQILKVIPDAKFKIIGKDALSLVPGLTMQEYIKKKLYRHLDKIEFGSVSFNEIPEVLAKTDVCVFPSLWENFPNVCLEAMSAGRSIVGSKEGGMKDMLEDVNAGILINPLKPKEIADAVIKLLRDKSLRMQLGQVARQKALTAYNSRVIGDLLEKNYSDAIRNKGNV